MTRTLALAGCAVIAAGLAGCESTQDKSARLAKGAKKAAAQTTISAGRGNPDVSVAETKVLSSNGVHAAVVQLRNRGRTAQVDVPVLIDVTGARNASLYKNDLKGLQPALQQMAYLPAGATAYWVNDQVVAAQTPQAVRAVVGQATASAPRTAPSIAVTGIALDHDVSGAYVTGTLHNHTGPPQVNMPVYVVAERNGQVAAAGRAIVPRLEREPTKKPVRFKAYLIGRPPTGARLVVRAVPTTFGKEVS